MKKTTRDNDERDTCARMFTRWLQRPEEGPAQEAERVLRSNSASRTATPNRNKVRMDDKARAAWSAYDRAIEGME